MADCSQQESCALHPKNNQLHVIEAREDSVEIKYGPTNLGSVLHGNDDLGAWAGNQIHGASHSLHELALISQR